MKNESVEALRLIEHFAALCATNGVDDKNKETANEYIHSLLVIIKEDITTLSASAKGIML